MTNQNQEDNHLPAKKESVWKNRRIGIGLVVSSFILYAGILLVPFTPFSVGIKLVISSTLAILGEITFWIGGFILGKQMVARYKKYLNPLYWFKK